MNRKFATAFTSVLWLLPNQIKSLLLSHHHSTSALVSEILMSVLQTVQKKQQTIYIWTDSAKKHKQFTWTDSAKKLHWSIYSAPDSAKNNNNLHMDRQCKKTTTIYIWTDSAKKQQQFTYGQTVQKTHWSIYSAPDSANKQQTIYIWTDSAKKQQQFTYGQYIFTDCTEDNVQNTHTYTQYT